MESSSSTNSVKRCILYVEGECRLVVESADWSKDGRWLTIGTRKCTVRMFPVDPYGGKADIASHLEGRLMLSVFI